VIRKRGNQPFFLYLAHTMPHIPLFASDDFRGKSLRGLYGDVVEEIDWSVGQILEEIRKEGIEEETLIIFTSDNGPWLVMKENGGSGGLLKEGKGTTWEGGMREPMIAWWPGKIPAGTTNYALTTTLDLLPTIAEISGAETPQDIDGYSMLKTLTDGETKPREYFAYYRNDEVYAVRYGPWKAHYITQSEYPAGPQQYHSPPLLYNLEVDPSERFNVSEGNEAVINEIDEWLKTHRKSIGTQQLPTIEAELMVDAATVSGGRLRIQNMANFPGTWGGNKQLWWVEAKPGDRLTFEIDRESTGKAELFGFFTRAGDYGIFSLEVNGKQAGALVDGYSEGIRATGAVPFGVVQLKKGKNEITLTLVGKDYRSAGYSDGYLVGIDGFLVR